MLGKAPEAATRLDEEEKGLIANDTPGAEQNATIINAPGPLQADHDEPKAASQARRIYKKTARRKARLGRAAPHYKGFGARGAFLASCRDEDLLRGPIILIDRA